MANVDFPRGFEVIRNGGAIEYFDLAATHDAIGKNDLVELRSDGFAHRAQASSVTIVGVAQESKLANAGGQIAVQICTQQTVLRAQSDDATIDAQTDLNLNYDIVVGSPTSLGFSVMEIDGSTGATTATLPIKVLRVEQIEQFDKTNTFGANVVVECKLNANAFNGGGAGV